MKCIIPGQNVKVLARAIHSLAKLGDELYVESSPSDLSFRTVNMSKTAYASFTFSLNFFSFFSDEPNESQDNGSIKCQISMKSSLSVFRSPITLDKTVDSLQIKLRVSSDKLLFHFKYKKGVLKTYSVPIIECESLQAYYLKETPNKLTIQPKIVGDILSNFQSNQDEITWKVTKSNVIIRNYSELEDVSSGVRTEICVEKDEFSEFKVDKETEITFCLKELRAALSFSDSVVLPLTANFSISSKPLVFVMKNEVFEANIVVSTLTGSDYVDTQTTSQQKTGEEPGQASTAREANIAGETSIARDAGIARGASIARKTSIDREASIARQASIDREASTVGEASVDRAASISQEAPSVNRHKRKNEEGNTSNSGKTKLKQLFSRCFEKDTFDVRNLPGYDIVLASDSDPDTDVEMK